MDLYDIHFHALIGTILCRRWHGDEEVDPIIYTQHGIVPYLPGLTEDQQNEWHDAVKQAGWMA